MRSLARFVARSLRLATRTDYRVFTALNDQTAIAVQSANTQYDTAIDTS